MRSSNRSAVRRARAETEGREAPASDTAQIRADLQRAGLRGTTSRIAVLGALGRSSTPLSHGELVEALSAHGFDRATLYRNLIDLTEAGLLRRIDFGDHTWRFERGAAGGAAPHAVARDQVHPHFVCVGCGALTCLPNVDVRISPRAGSPRPPIADVSQVLIQGRCSAC